MQLRALALSLLTCLLVLPACGDDDAGAGPDSGARTDAGTPPAPLPDAAPTDGRAADDAGETSCEVGPPPAALPAIEGRFVIVGAAGGPAEEPAPTGGSPIGTWVVEDVTIYVGPTADGQLDTSLSSVTGRGWLRITPPDAMGVGSYALDFDLEVTLETSVVGTIVRNADNRARGTYSVGATGAIEVVPECTLASTMGEGAPEPGMLQVSRDGEAETALLFIELDGMLGRSLFVADLRLVP